MIDAEVLRRTASAGALFRQHGARRGRRRDATSRPRIDRGTLGRRGARRAAVRAGAARFAAARPHPRVILTPHAAFYSVESEKELRRKAAQNIVTLACDRQARIRGRRAARATP